MCSHALAHSWFPTDFALYRPHWTGDQMNPSVHAQTTNPLVGPWTLYHYPATVGQMGPWRQCLAHCACVHACTRACVHTGFVDPIYVPPHPPKVPELTSSRSTPYLLILETLTCNMQHATLHCLEDKNPLNLKGRNPATGLQPGTRWQVCDCRYRALYIYSGLKKPLPKWKKDHGTISKNLFTVRKKKSIEWSVARL